MQRQNDARKRPNSATTDDISSEGAPAPALRAPAIVLGESPLVDSATSDIFANILRPRFDDLATNIALSQTCTLFNDYFKPEKLLKLVMLANYKKAEIQARANPESILERFCIGQNSAGDYVRRSPLEQAICAGDVRMWTFFLGIIKRTHDHELRKRLLEQFEAQAKKQQVEVVELLSPLFAAYTALRSNPCKETWEALGEALGKTLPYWLLEAIFYGDEDEEHTLSNVPLPTVPSLDVTPYPFASRIHSDFGSRFPLPLSSRVNANSTLYYADPKGSEQSNCEGWYEGWGLTEQVPQALADELLLQDACQNAIEHRKVLIESLQKLLDTSLVQELMQCVTQLDYENAKRIVEANPDLMFQGVLLGVNDAGNNVWRSPLEAALLHDNPRMCTMFLGIVIQYDDRWLLEAFGNQVKNQPDLGQMKLKDRENLTIGLINHINLQPDVRARLVKLMEAVMQADYEEVRKLMMCCPEELMFYRTYVGKNAAGVYVQRSPLEQALYVGDTYMCNILLYYACSSNSKMKTFSEQEANQPTELHNMLQSLFAAYVKLNDCATAALAPAQKFFTSFAEINNYNAGKSSSSDLLSDAFQALRDAADGLGTVQRAVIPAHLLREMGRNSEVDNNDGWFPWDHKKPLFDVDLMPAPPPGPLMVGVVDQNGRYLQDLQALSLADFYSGQHSFLVRGRGGNGHAQITSSLLRAHANWVIPIAKAREDFITLQHLCQKRQYEDRATLRAKVQRRLRLVSAVAPTAAAAPAPETGSASIPRHN